MINNNAVANTIADVTGLTFPVITGTRYQFECRIWYQAAAATTGSRWSINGPTTALLLYKSNYTLTNIADTINTYLVAYNTPAASNASSLATPAPNMAELR